MAALLPLLAAFAAAPSRGSEPSALFVLGDSLSDVGNAAAAADYLLSLPLEPPTVGLCNPADVLVWKRRCDDLFYGQSRVSDGAVAVEHLAAHFALAPLRPSLHVLPNQRHEGTVYAVAGAKARGESDADLHRQVDWLLIDHAPLPADALYVVMIGGNDAIDALQADVAYPSLAPTLSTAIVTAAVEAIAEQVERLLDFGARRVIVANVPDLSVLPAVRVAAQASGNEAAALASASEISAAFARELDTRIAAIEARWAWVPEAAAIVRFDLQAALAGAQAALAGYGANVVDACFATETYRDSPAAQRVFHPECAPATADDSPRFAAFAFFDGIHPTGTAHAALGKALVDLAPKGGGD
jgi:phospholipase/lecithinase/hemolysin